MRYLPLLVLSLAVAAPSPVRAEDDLLTRDEVSTIKKKLVGVLDAFGAPPAGFVKEKDDFNLPTNFYKSEGKLQPVNASVSRHLAIKGVKDAEKGQKALGEDYQKKIMEAQMKGDYAEMARISQEMQTKGSENALSGMKAQSDKKEPIELRVSLNESADEGIDPDNVVAEKPGMIAIKYKNGSDDDVKETVKLFFQPAALKDTKKLSKVRLFSETRSVPAKTSVGSVVVEISGPAADVEAWAKRADAAKILALIDAPGK